MNLQCRQTRQFVMYEQDIKDYSYLINEVIIINKIYYQMIRPKRYSINRAALRRQDLGELSNELQIEGISEYSKIENQKRVAENNKYTSNQRLSLIEISNTIDIQSQNIFGKVPQLFSYDDKLYPQVRPKGKENIITKITELVKNEEMPVPQSAQSKQRQNHRQIVHKRPSTSLGQQQRSLDITNLKRCSVVFDLGKREESQQQEKESTSRALMNYSKVCKNTSHDRFKVKRHRSILPKFGELSAQKIQIFSKQKKSKKELCQNKLQKSVTFKQRLKSKIKKPRYIQNEQFQIAGWEYFQ